MPSVPPVGAFLPCPRIAMPLLCLGLWSSAVGAELPLAGALAGRPGGLAVQIGGDPGPALGGIGSGVWLLQGLAADEAGVGAWRSGIAAAGRLGQASARAWSGGRLPYGSGMVDVLVVAAAPVPAEAEVMRVLTPRGEAWLPDGGGWRRIVKPWDARLAGWTHWNADAQGTNATRDAVSGPGASLRFHVTDHVTDLRMEDGILVHINGNDPKQRRERPQAVPDGCMGRSAFNGVPLWAVPGGMRRHNFSVESFTMDATRAIWFPDVDKGPAAAYDLRTGAVLIQYDQGITRQSASGNDIAFCCQVLAGGRLFQSKDRELIALDAASGKRLWTWTAEGPIRRLVADAEGKRCYVLEAAAEGVGARWRSVRARSIACVADGKLVWRQDKLVSERANDLSLSGDSLIYHTSATNMDPGDSGTGEGEKGRPVPHVVRLKAADGTQVWHTSTGPISMGGPRPWLNNLVVRDDAVWGSPGAQRFAYADGVTAQQAAVSLNFRCVRMTGTADWLVYGFNVWQHRDGSAWNLPVARGDCAQPAFPGMGGVFFPNNIVCNCVMQLHGLVAIQADAEPEPIPDGERLAKGGPGPLAAGADVVPPAPLALDWTPHFLATWLLDRSPVASDGAWKIEIDADRGRVRASRDGAPAWTQVLDGRILGAPLIHAGRVYVGCADGTVRAIALDGGATAWRFTAALGREQVVADGQVESRWPVYAPILHQGRICVAAGRQDSLDGGIMVWGLDPQSGAPAWRIRLHTPMAKAAGGGAKAMTANDQSVVNGALAEVDGKLALLTPSLAKSGSSPTQTGYYRWPKDVQPWSVPGELSARATVLDPVAMDGRTITVGALAGKKK